MFDWDSDDRDVELEVFLNLTQREDASTGMLSRPGKITEHLTAQDFYLVRCDGCKRRRPRW